jgi:hypothetical protein
MSVANTIPNQYTPLHKVYTPNVEFPTVFRGDGESPLLEVQWFGEADKEMLPNVTIPEGNQFRFPIRIDPNDFSLFGDPEKFFVPFLGKAKDWNLFSPESTQGIIAGPADGDPDCLLIWILNAQVGMDFGGHPASPIVKIVLLADPNCGIIIPKRFADLTRRDLALEAHSAQYSYEDEDEEEFGFDDFDD